MSANPPRLPVIRPAFGEAEARSVAACLESGWVTQGPRVSAFEDRFAARHEVRHALATTSCTAALHLAMLALEIGPGDEVVVPAFTWVTSASCAEYVGARAVFADVDERTFNLDPARFEQAITPRTRAVVIVHLFGLAAPMDALLDIARRHDLAVIEDAACAAGTSYAGRPVGGLGDIGCFSFHPRKVITTGEGGMVTTHDDALADRVRMLRNHGATPSDDDPPGPWTMARFDHIGYNLRMSDIQAAVGVAQMDRMDGLLAERRALADSYVQRLRDVDGLMLPEPPEPCGHTYQSFVVQLRAGDAGVRNAVMSAMSDDGIDTRPGTHAVHRLGFFRERDGLEPGDFPRAAAAEDRSITLPLFPGMTDAEQDRVVTSLRAALERCLVPSPRA